MKNKIVQNRILDEYEKEQVNSQCPHETVILNGYEKCEDSTFLEEADGTLERASYFCLDCGSVIKVPVTPRFAKIIEFESKSEVVMKCQKKLLPEELVKLREQYRERKTNCRNQEVNRSLIKAGYKPIKCKNI